MLALVLVGSAAAFYSFVSPAARELERDKVTQNALAKAKDALIGYAASNANQPGVLPCPDNDNDGSADAPCGASGVTAVGRLPWKTLGLPDLRDGWGECLWYAVSGNFKNSGVSGPSVLNSDSAGTLTINDSAGAALYTGFNSVPAIVFAPGVSLGTQVRNVGAASPCGGNTIVANYLEGGNENGVATSTFFTGQATSAFNDKLLPITSDALFSVVNVRVAKEAIAALNSYRGTNSYYPFANSYGSAAPYNCTSGLIRGRFPITLTGCGQTAWGAELPGWFSLNNWNLVTHFAMSKACGQLGLPLGLDALAMGACDLLGNLSGVIGLINAVLPLFTDDPITVTGVSANVRALVIVTGRAQAAQVHACASEGQCMEDAANTDGDSTYVKPSRFPASNDRMALSCATSVTCAVVP